MKEISLGLKDTHSCTQSTQWSDFQDYSKPTCFEEPCLQLKSHEKGVKSKESNLQKQTI